MYLDMYNYRISLMNETPTTLVVVLKTPTTLVTPITFHINYTSHVKNSGNAIRHPPKVGRVGNRLQKTT